MIRQITKPTVTTYVSAKISFSSWSLFSFSGSSELTSGRRGEDRSIEDGLKFVVVLQKIEALIKSSKFREMILRAMTNSIVDEAHDFKQRPA